MHRLTPSPGEIWRHFRGGDYEIVTISHEPEKGMRPFVVYKGVLTGTTWHRPLDEFMGSVPSPEEPALTRVFRFEAVKTSTS